MKTKLTLLFIVIFTTLGLSAQKADSQNKKNKKEEVLFDVSMTCESCKKRIEKNVSFEKGVSDLVVNLPAKTVLVQYNPQKTDKEKIQKAIEKLGYTVTEKEQE